MLNVSNAFSWEWVQFTAERTKQFFLNVMNQNPADEYFPEFLRNKAQMVAQAARNHPYIAIGSTVLLGGLGVYFTFFRGHSATPQEALMDAVRHNQEAQALTLIDNMTIEELNRPAQNGQTVLALGLKKSRKVCEKLIERSLAENTALNTQMANGTSIFDNPSLTRKLLSYVNGHHKKYSCVDATRLLGATVGQYKEYACLDATRFRGNINQQSDVDEILSRKPFNQMAYTQSIQIQPIRGGKFSRQQIKTCAELVDKSKAGVCTTFALAAADKLLTLFPNERIQVVAHNGGANGSHVYVVMNHHRDHWQLNDLKGKALESDEAEQIIQEFEKAYIVDPWLASLGWKDGIFDFDSYADQFSGFLYDAEIRFDNQQAPRVRLVS